MPNTSSYFVKTKKTDDTCFAGFINSMAEKYSKDYYVIIEPEKQIHGLETALLYINRLKEAGLCIADVISNDNGEIHVYFNPSTRAELKLATIAIRFLWEGVYKQKTQDHFYIIHDHFMRLCDYYPEKDHMSLLCFAHCLFMPSRGIARSYTNTNHAFSDGGCAILTEGQKLQDSGYLQNTTNHEYDTRCFEEIAKIDKYKTKEDYDKAMERFNIYSKTYKI